MIWLNIAGLVFAFAGALWLLKYQSPAVLWVTREGEGMIAFTNSPTPEQREANKAQWQKYMGKYRFGVGLLAFGFFLQLFAMILEVIKAA
jgi:hypothetical protein